MNNPAMFEILGDIQGKSLLDLGCGEGYNTRIMAKKGAKVIGIDFSEKMIDFAIQHEEEEILGIEYHVLDACNLHIFEDNTFDIVACFMALMDIDDYQTSIREVARVLKRTGRFVFIITHPCFDTITIGNTITDAWEFKEEGDISSENALFYKVDKYFANKSNTFTWKGNQINEPFETTSFLRTLTDYSNALYNTGLMISRIYEPRPTERGLAKYPKLKLCLRIPHSIVIEAVKC